MGVVPQNVFLGLGCGALPSILERTKSRWLGSSGGGLVFATCLVAALLRAAMVVDELGLSTHCFYIRRLGCTQHVVHSGSVVAIREACRDDVGI